MKRSSSQGFILTETLVVSVILMVVFLFVFSQFLLIFTQYREFESYNKVPYVYNARNMAIFLKEDNYDNIISSLKNNYYFDFTSCPNPIEFTSYCEGLINEMDIKTALLTPYDLQAVINNNPSDFSHRLKQYLKYLQKNKDNPGEYRVILEFNDGTFSSYTIGSEYAYPTKQQYRYRRGYIYLDGTKESNGSYISSINNNFTMEFWAMPNTTHEIDVQSNSGTAGTAGQNYIIAASKGDNDNAGSGVSLGTNGISVYEHSTSYMPALLVYKDDLMGWKHYAIVYKNKKPYLYINGKFIKAGLESPRPKVYPSCKFGGLNYGKFNGYMKEFKIWNKALDPIEINNSMIGKVTDITNLVYHYKLSEGVGNTIVDYVANSNLSMTNTSWEIANFSNWQDEKPPTGMYPVIETRTLYYYEGEWYTALELEILKETELIGYWKLDGNALDYSKSKNHGKVNNTILAEDRYGAAGEALYFNGINSYVEIPYNNIPSLTRDFTIEFWLKLTKFPPSFASFVSKFVDDKNNEFNLRLIKLENGEYGGQFYYGTGSKAIVLNFKAADFIKLNKWVHIAAVKKDGQYMKLYFNGIVGPQKTDGLETATSTDATILLMTQSKTRYNEGIVDDLRIYNRALTDIEIKHIYDIGNN